MSQLEDKKTEREQVHFCSAFCSIQTFKGWDELLPPQPWKGQLSFQFTNTDVHLAQKHP